MPLSCVLCMNLTSESIFIWIWRRANPSPLTIQPPIQTWGLDSRSDPHLTASTDHASNEMFWPQMLTQMSKGEKGWHPITCTPWKLSSNPHFATVSNGSKTSLWMITTMSELNHVLPVCPFEPFSCRCAYMKNHMIMENGCFFSSS